MNLDQSQISRIIEILHSFSMRKQMYLSPVSVEATINHLHGFRLAFSALEVTIPYTCYEQAYRQRGWNYTARDVWHDMRERGMDDDAITGELIMLEILTWNIMLENLS